MNQEKIEYRLMLLEKRRDALDELRDWRLRGLLCMGLFVPCFIGGIYGILTDFDIISLSVEMILCIGAAGFLATLVTIILPAVGEAKKNAEKLSIENINRLCELHARQKVLSAAAAVQNRHGFVDPQVFRDFAIVIEDEV